MILGTRELRFYGVPVSRPIAGFPRCIWCAFISPSSETPYKRHQPFCGVLGARRRSCGRRDLSTQSTGTPAGRQRLFRGRIGGFSMTSRQNEAAIDEIVARCNGDLHGALKALLLVNEHLEAEIAQLYAAVALGGPFERGNNALH